MPAPLDTAQRLTQNGTPKSREIRIHFESRASLLNGFALAQKETWIEDCQVDLSRLELVIRTAGGFSVRPRRSPAPRRRGKARLSLVRQAC